MKYMLITIMLITGLFAQFSRGTISAGALFNYSSSEEGGGLRFVVVAPKKNFPRAVDRNKIKRRMREIVRKKRSLLESSGFNWFLFVYLKEEVLSSGAMQKELTKLIRSL